MALCLLCLVSSCPVCVHGWFIVYCLQVQTVLAVCCVTVFNYIYVVRFFFYFVHTALLLYFLTQYFTYIIIIHY